MVARQTQTGEVNGMRSGAFRFCKHTAAGLRTAGVMAAVMAFVIGCGARKPTDEAHSAPKETVSQPVELTPELITTLERAKDFKLGIEVEQGRNGADLKFERIALFINDQSADQRGVSTAQLLRDDPQFTLFKVAIPGAQPPSPCLTKAIEGVPAEKIVRLRDQGPLNENDFADVTAIVWDIPLTGMRFSPEVPLLGRVMEMASKRDMKVVVLDRPTLLPVLMWEGPVADRDAMGSENAYFPLPTLPGLTAGELASLINAEFALQTRLIVVPMENWNRKDANGPLAGSRSTVACPAGGDASLAAFRAVAALLNGSLEQGSGPMTARAGADAAGPFLAINATDGEKAAAVRKALEELDLGGVAIAAGETATGSSIILRGKDGEVLMPVELSLQIYHALSQGKLNIPESATKLFGSRVIEQGLARGLTPDQIRRRWSITQDARDWPERREKYILYPEGQ